MAGWLDRMLFRARNARSDAELEEVRREMEGELPPSLVGHTNGHSTNDGLSIGTGEDGTHLHLHLGGGGGAPAGGGAMPGMTGDEPSANTSPPAPNGGGSPNTAGGDVNTRLAAVEAAVAQLTQQMAELSGGDEGQEVELQDPDTKDARTYLMRRRRKVVGDEGSIPTPERNPDMIYETDLPGIEDLNGRRARSGSSGGIGDGVTTGDSFQMEEIWQDTMAKGEIIVPGIRVPTFDGRVNPQITAKRLCSFRRQTMDAAIRNDTTKDLVENVTNLKTADQIKNLRCDTLKMAFDVVAGAIGGSRNNTIMRASVGDGASRPVNGQRGGVPSLAELQRRNKEAWKTGAYVKPTIQ